MLNIVLVEPEMPQNTGNIIRTCAVIGARLHLIEPLGFVLDDAHLKRAGLDYFDKVEVIIYKNLGDFFSKNDGEFYFATTKAKHTYVDPKYEKKDTYIFFGKESKGLPEDLLYQYYDRCIRIPMRENLRSLNLSNSVAIIAYEYFRQIGFDNLQEYGQLTNIYLQDKNNK